MTFEFYLPKFLISAIFQTSINKAKISLDRNWTEFNFLIFCYQHKYKLVLETGHGHKHINYFIYSVILNTNGSTPNTLFYINF